MVIKNMLPHDFKEFAGPFRNGARIGHLYKAE